MNAQPGLLAKKLGMTQLFLADGTRVPVTVLAVGGNTVLAHRTQERDGYVALQVAFDEQKPARLSKPDLGRFKQANVTPRRLVREFRVDGSALEKYPVGSDIPTALFPEGELVDVTGTSKGKGFQGVMKRHKMKGKPDSHGVHEYFRHGGSVGCRLTPGRIFPGKRMCGHMGQDTKTIQNVKVAKVDETLGVVLVRGSIPGANGTYVTIRTAHKAALRKAHKEGKRATP
jgi:large subunit ribosomal protein L3